MKPRSRDKKTATPKPRPKKPPAKKTGLKIPKDVAALRRRIEELERSNADLEAYAASASHDLQEPLRKIIAFGDILKESSGSALEESGRDSLDAMLRASARLQRLIRAFLEYAKVNADPCPPDRVELRSVLADVQAELEERLAATDSTLVVEKLPAVRGDYLQLRQLFQNLVENALKFRSPQRPLRIKVRARPSSGGRSLLSVEDNGIGFDEKFLGRVFEPLQRLHTREQYKGSGMGLAICRKIAERHQGELTASSVPGVGSTFTVSLLLDK